MGSLTKTRAGAWLVVLAVGVPLSLTMAIVSAAMAEKVAVGMMGHAERKAAAAPLPASVTLTPKAANEMIDRAPTAASSTTAPSGTPAPTPDPIALRSSEPVGASSDSDVGAISNVMTAVSAAIAAVALIFSVGVVWLGNYLKDLQDLRQTLEQKLRDLQALGKLVEEQDARRQEDFDRRIASLREEMGRIDQAAHERLMQFEERSKALANIDRARVELLRAKDAVGDWLRQHSASPDRHAFQQVIVSNLESLLIDDDAIRHEAFGRLIGWLSSFNERLREVDNFVQSCHRLHGGTSSTFGVWCLIFSPVEKAAYLAERAARAGPLC